MLPATSPSVRLPVRPSVCPSAAVTDTRRWCVFLTAQVYKRMQQVGGPARPPARRAPECAGAPPSLTLPVGVLRRQGSVVIFVLSLLCFASLVSRPTFWVRIYSTFAEYCSFVVFWLAVFSMISPILGFCCT